MQRETLSSLAAGLTQVALVVIAAMELPPLTLFHLQRSDIASPGPAAISVLFRCAVDFPQPRLTQPGADSIDCPGCALFSPDIFEIDPNVKSAFTQVTGGAVIYAISLTTLKSESHSFASQCDFSFQSTRAGPVERVFHLVQGGRIFRS